MTGSMDANATTPALLTQFTTMRASIFGCLTSLPLEAPILLLVLRPSKGLPPPIPICTCYDGPIKNSLISSVPKLPESIHERNNFTQFSSEKGCVLAYKVYWSSCVKGVHTGNMVLRLVEAIDVYLAGTIMLIFGMFFYGLFISNTPHDMSLWNVCFEEHQNADILTKALPKARFEFMRKRLGICSSSVKEECLMNDP
ncbi:transmembrane protein, putative [Medicago truncatula]|uniref:Transmembrane protein, putative n=1 Tax=Medicago truncatula TaxID=3880 RepID=G7IWZ9_MEDTR|nr:transmembrane protein, putative [Medicago truncatula]